MFFVQLAIGVTHPHRRLCSCLSWCDHGDNGQKDAVHHKPRHMNANALLLPHPANSALSRTSFERCHGKFPKRYGALKRSIYHIRAWGPQSLRPASRSSAERAQLSRKGSETRATVFCLQKRTLSIGNGKFAHCNQGLPRRKIIVPGRCIYGSGSAACRAGRRRAAVLRSFNKWAAPPATRKRGPRRGSRQSYRRFSVIGRSILPMLTNGHGVW